MMSDPAEIERLVGMIHRSDRLIAELERGLLVAKAGLDQSLTEGVAAGQPSALTWVREVAILEAAVKIAREGRAVALQRLSEFGPA